MSVSDIAMSAEDRTLGACRSDPALIDKMVTLQKLYADLDRQSRIDASVPRAVLTADQFYNDYFYPNRPVILEGLMDDWPARTKWTFTWMREKFGKYSVEIHGDRTVDEEYEQHFSAGRRTVRFADFMTMLENDTATNDSYIVGRNHLLSRPEFHCLLDDIKSPAGFLDATETKPRHLSIWIGPRGTVTPLHHDRGSVFFGQVRGRKRFKLIAPFYLPSVYNLPGTCYSEVPLDRPLDLTKYPLMQNVPIVEAVLNPGDFLLIPVAWWHWVKAEDASVSVTFKNFLFRGERLAWDYR